MRSALTLLAIALLGLFGATSIGYAAYVVSRDSVGLPVTKLKLSPNDLAPVRTTPKAADPPPKTTRTTTTRTSTTDDHGGRSPGSGKGSGDSGPGGDDD
jgi:hypothetical protein